MSRSAIVTVGIFVPLSAVLLLAIVLIGLVDSAVAQEQIRKSEITNRFWSQNSEQSLQRPFASPAKPIRQQPASNASAVRSRVVAGSATNALIPAIYQSASQLTATAPTGVAVGDFNNDDKLDWVVASGEEQTLWLYLGNGDGTARQPVAIWPGGKYAGSQQQAGAPGLPPTPVWVTAADLRGNGVLDLVIAEGNENYTVAILLGNGDGTFQPAQRLNVYGTGTQVVVADLNNDGKQDIAIGLLNGGIRVFLGDGAGNFSAGSFPGGIPSSPPASSDPQDFIDGLPTTIDVADYDHDGIPDLLYSGEWGTWVMRGIGNGQFNAQQQLFEQLHCAGACLIYSTTARWLDVNGDGFVDAILAESGGVAEIHLNHEDGMFDAAYSASFSVSLGLIAGDLLVDDVNHDGKLDFVAGSQYFPLNPYGSTFAGQSAGSLFCVSYGDGSGKFSNPRLFRGGTGVVALAKGDLNRDGFTDFITADQYSSTYTLLLNDKKGGFGVSQGANLAQIDSGLTNYASAFYAVTDIDGDGSLDFATVGKGRNWPYLSVALNDGKGAFYSARLTQLPTTQTSTLQPFVFGRFRGATSADAVVSLDQMYFLPNLGNGQFGTPSVIGNWSAWVLAAGDVDGDGKTDLVGQDAGRVHVALGHGDGTFDPPIFTTVSTMTEGKDVLVRDLNGDGKSDVLVWTYNGQLFELLGKGDGTFQPGTLILTSRREPAFADVNHDGKLDIVASGPTDGDIAIYLGSGDGTFTLANTYSYPGLVAIMVSGSNIIAGDFDGDGNVDVVVRGIDQPFGFFYLLAGNGDGSFTPIYRFYPLYTSFGQMSSADVNGDGRVDLVEFDTYPLSVHYMSGQAVLPSVDLYFTSSSQFQDTGNVGAQLDVAASSAEVALSAIPTSVSVPTALSFDAASSFVTFNVSVPSSYDPAQVFSITSLINGATSSIFGSKPFNPIPRLGTLHAGVIVEGDPGFTLTIPGAGFTSDAVATWDGNSRTTRYVNSTQVQIDLQTTDLVNGSHAVAVRNPGPGGGISEDEYVFVNKNEVYISQLSPNRLLVGTAAATVAVYGDIFSSNSVVLLDNIAIPTRFVSQYQVTFDLSATQLSTPGQHTVTISDSRNGGLKSNTVTFVIVANTPPLGELESFGNSLNGSHTIGTRGRLVFKGWAADNESNPVSAVFFSIGGLRVSNSPANLPRQDIAARYNRPDWSNSGFEAIGGCCLTPGTYSVDATAKDIDGATATLPITAADNKLTVVNGPFVYGALESVAGTDGSLTVEQNSTVVLNGWSYVGSNYSLPSAVRVYLNDISHPVGDALVGVNRPDLVAAKNEPRLINSGFAFQFNVGDASIGPHYVMAEAFNSVGDVQMLLPASQATVLINVVAPSPNSGRRVLSLSSSALTFSPQVIGLTGSTATLTLRNDGSAKIDLPLIVATGDFTTQYGCRALSPGQSCNVAVTFNPTVAGARSGGLAIYSNATNSPQNVSLSGTGIAPEGKVSAQLLQFGGQLVNTTSSSQTVTFQNSGSVPFSLTDVRLTGDFNQQNNCTAQIQPGASCAIAVTFTPHASGNASGTLSITTSPATGIPTVTLSGMGQEFGLSAGTGGSTSASITAGQSASFTLLLSSTGGLNLPVVLACSGAPAYATCAVNPTSGNVTDANPLQVNVSVTTKAVSGSQVHVGVLPVSGSAVYAATFLSLLVLMVFAVTCGARKPAWVSTTVVALVLLALGGCGGGGGGSSIPSTPTTPSQSGTAPGTYTLAVTATSGNLVRTINLTLMVR